MARVLNRVRNRPHESAIEQANAPLCYPNDITDEMLKQYRASHGISGGSQ
jgi:hypothetical protein